MREEITEPQHWRQRSGGNPSRPTRRRTALPLPAEVVDAALAEELPVRGSRTDSAEADVKNYPELIEALSNQLAYLESQNEQLQKLLTEAGNRS